MTADPAVLGATLATVLGVLGVARARRRAHPGRSCVAGLVRLFETYLKGQADIALEQEHRATVIAEASMLRPGEVLIDRRADGAKLVIKAAPARRLGAGRTQADRPTGELGDAAL